MNLTELSAKLTPWVDAPWKQSLLVLGGSIIAAFLTDLIFSRVLRRLASKTKTDIDDRILEGLHKPIFFSVVLIGIYVAIQRLEIQNVYEKVFGRVLMTVAILIWAGVLIKVSGLVLEVLSRHRDRFKLIDRATLALFENVAKVGLYSGAAYLILRNWGLDNTALLAGASVFGLGVGFAAKDTIADFISGVFILTDKPYELGDYINLDSGERGEVTQIGLRTTRLLSRDDIEITIPNSVMGQAKIVNENGGRWPKERIRVKIGVAYGSDIDQVLQVLHDVGVDHEEVCQTPEPRVRLRSFGDSSLDLELLCWIEEPVLRGRILHELNVLLYKALAENDIEIPYPKRDVYLHQVEPSP